MGKSYIALLWHHHQPPYRDPSRPDGALALPWVRLHAARDYYQMGWLAAENERLRVTFNFTPSLLTQFDAYLEEGRRDVLMDLSLRAPADLEPAERERLTAACFDVDFHHAVKNHPRFFKLYRMYYRGEAFGDQDLLDAVALFNLAWIGEIFREGGFELATGTRLDLRELFDRGYGYGAADIRAIIAAQLEIMRAVVPLHRRLRDEGRLEVSVTPMYHPILPLLHDSDLAVIDRPGSRHPRRFAYSEDAREQVRRGRDVFTAKFGGELAGMWPAEGAVGEGVLPYFEESGIKWIATDEGVLARSGPGFDVQRPEVLFRPYRVGRGDLAIFFRHRGLSDAIGFVYQHWKNADAAAADFCRQLHALLDIARARSPRDALVSVILDGENAWGAYPRHGVPFLRALYGRLARGDVARAVTFSEYLLGNPEREVAPHPPRSLDALADVAYASWIDEAGSEPGNDLGTWVGEPEENLAWELLGAARACYEACPARDRRQRAREYLLAAEASDWFWWYGDDQGGGADEEFDRLFRAYVKAVYLALGEGLPPEVDEPIAPARVVWRPERPIPLKVGDLLVVEWPYGGEVRFGVNGWQDARQARLLPTHGVMGRRDDVFRAPLLRIGADVVRVEMTFQDRAGAWLGYDFFIPIG